MTRENLHRRRRVRRGRTQKWWSIDQDGKATFENPHPTTPTRKCGTLEIAESDVQKQMDAAGVCPVTVIHVFDPDGNQKI
jgi:ferredoxin